MKKVFEKLERQMTRGLTLLSFIALMVVGLIIAFTMFRELYDMAIFAWTHEPDGHYFEILQSVVSFFIFFEFLTLVVMAIRNRGHVSLLFLLTLGITALIRMLLTYHENLIGLVAISGSILILIVGAILLKHFIFADNSEDEHL